MKSSKFVRCCAYACASLLSLLFISKQAHAQTQTTGFALDRFEPAERGSQFFVNETLDFRGDLHPALGATLDYGYKPLVVYDPFGNERSSIVRHQLVTHLGGSLVLADRIRVGLNVPIAVYQDGETSIVNREPYKAADKFAFGDIRLAADARLVGEYGDALTLAGGLRAWLPSGQRSQFTGDGSTRLAPQVMAAGDLGPLTYAARLALVYRARDDVYAGSSLGSELLGSVGVGLKALDKQLVIGPEVFATSVLSEFFKSASTPAEWIFGLHYGGLGDLRFGGGVGGGLTRGYGAPQLRGLLSIEWVPTFEKPDRDHDSIFDSEDACPDVSGPSDPDPKKNGCPSEKPPDADGDTIPDAEDACPNDAGPRTSDSKTNGCPPDRDGDGIIDNVDACPDVQGVKDPADPKKNGCPVDRDGDGIPDAEDACPDAPGVKDGGDPKRNGCPPDRDGDGVVDTEDACPDVVGPRDPDPKKNGCPLVVITEKEIKINQEVTFKAADSAELLPESDTILGAVKQVLDAHPEIKKIRVEGHTDNVGKPDDNKKLSQKRAASVAKWITDKGIDKKRLVSEGYGQDKPIDTNDTDAGRANNRRVAFTILEREGAAAATTTAPKPDGAAKPDATKPLTPTTTPPQPAPAPKP